MNRLRQISKIWILLALCLALYLPGLSRLPATDRDESRYMQATHQMVESGDFIDIRFQDDARHKKPVGIYWLQAGVSKAAQLIGISPTERASYRAVSTIGATSAVLALFLGFRRLMGEHDALISAVFLSATLLLSVEAHLAKTDAMQLAAIVTMQAGLARLYCVGNTNGSWQARLLFWLGLSLGILIKGPVAPAIATMTLAWICWKERSFWPLRALQPLRWLALPLVIVGPWLLIIQSLSDGQFVQDSIGRDFLAKILEAQESHGAPPGTYLLVTPILLWPVSWLLIPKAWLGLQSLEKRNPRLTTFAIAWLVPSWLLFEIMPTKLPHYVLPLIPALCLLGGIGFSQSRDQQQTALAASKWPQRIGWAAWIFAGLIIVVGLPAVSIWSSGRISTPALLVSLLGIATIVLAPRLKNDGQRLLASTAAAVIIFGLIFELALPQLKSLWPAEIMRKIIDSHGLANVPVAITGYHEPSVVFNLGTDTKLTDINGVVSHISSNPETIAIVPLGQADELQRQLSQEVRLNTLGEINGFNYSKGKAINLALIHTVRAPELKPIPAPPLID